MNGVRPLALILAVVTGCAVLASLWPHLAGGQASLPAEVVEGAVLHQDCVDDVSVTISSQWGVVDRNNNYELKNPPDYKAGDDIRIYYDVSNSSCSNVTVTVELKGSVTGAVIHNIDDTDEMACLEGCTINTGGTLNGNVGWDLGKHPNATGEKVVASVTISAPSDFVDTDTSNNSATSAQAINIVNEEPAPDIAVRSVKASRTTVVIGEAVDFTVVVRNKGDADAAADTTVTLDHGEGTDDLDSETVSALAAKKKKKVKLTWDTSGAEAGKHTLRILVSTEGDDNSDNDSSTATVTLVAPSVDAAVKSVTASATEALVGDTITFTVTLENAGNVPAPWPQVSLFDADAAADAEPLASQTADTSVPVGGELTVKIPWDTSETEAGKRNLRVQAQTKNDDNSDNDSATASLTLHNPVDVGVSFADATASSVVSGTTAEIGFTLNNTGDHDTGEVTIRLYVTPEGEERGEQEPAAATTVPTVAAGDAATGTLDWDTAGVAVGRYDLEVVIQTIGDTDATNNEASHSIEIRNWLTIKNVSPQSKEVVTGDTIEYTAQVENVGQGELTGVTVGLYESGTDDALDDVDFASIAAAGTADATIRWDTAGWDAGQVELFVSAGADGQVGDGDDYQSVNVTIRNPVALSSATPASANNIAGTSVSINVEVLNESDVEVTDVAVDLFVGDSEDAGGSTTIQSIAAGKTVATSLTWDASDAEPGEHQLKIVASLAGYGSDPNDAVSLTVDLSTPMLAVALTTATINRSVAVIGQTLDVTVTVTNHGEVPVAVPISLYLVERLEQTTAASTATSPLIEPGSSADVMLPWDSTGETAGTHTLKVVAELPEDTTANDNERLLEVGLFPSAFDGARAVNSCHEDIRVKVTDIRDLSDQKRSPPNYYVGETLKAAYRIYNFSCQTDVTLAITMSGPQDNVISDAEALCFANCVVPFGGKVEDEVAWTIPTLPALSDQPVNAQVSRVSPADFADANKANNSAESTDRINIVHPDDVVLRLGEQNDNKVSTRHTLTGPKFGVVDVRLVSAKASQSALAFAAETVEIVVAVANDGATTEPIAVRFVLAPDDGTDPRELHRHTMVLQNGQTRTETVEVPLRDVPPGVHTIKVLLSAAVDRSPGNNAASVEITRVAPLVNVEMEDVVVSPEVLMLGDEATIRLTIQNGSEVTLPLTVNVYLDADPRPIASENTGELEPDRPYKGQLTWKIPASGNHLGQHRLKLEATSTEYGRVAVFNKDVTLHINAEIVGISTVPEGTAMQGEEVEILVEVRNNGPATANVPVTLRFPSATKDPEVRSPPVRPGETGTARFAWKTRNYAVGDHKLTATVPEQHNTAGGGTSMELPFRVSPLAVTATIMDVSAYPTAPMVGEPVTITVTVRNDGPVATKVPITLHFPPGGRRPDSRKPHLDPGETGTVVFEWRTGNYRTGTHQFRIEVAAVGNPVTYLNVELSPPVVNATIVDVAVNPEIPRLGEPVTISVTVQNDGWIPTNIPVTLHFPSDEKLPETQRPRVEPGAVGSVAFTWRTSRYEPGIHDFRVEVASDPPASQRFEVELLPPIVDVAIVGMGSDPSESAVKGQAVKVWVDVINNGPSALNVPVQLAFPSSDKQPERKSTWIEPRQTARVEFTWRTANYDPGIHTLTATLLAEYNITQLDTSATIQIRLVSPRLAASIVDVSWHPASPVVGEPVRITVTVRNNASVATNIPVTLYFPSGDRQPETKRPRVAPGVVGSADFTWRTSRYEPGDHLFRVQIPGVPGAVRTFEIELRPPEVDFAVVDLQTPDPLHPIVKGDWVEITVVVQNQGPYSGRGTVYLLNGDNPDAMYEQAASLEPGEFREVEFTWKTLRYPVGGYELLARVDAEHDTDPSNDRSDLAPVHLLTDRDITVGFGNVARPAVFAEPTSEAALRSAPWYSNDIQIAGVGRFPIDRTMGPASGSPMGVSPKPTGGNYDPARMYWWWRSAQLSPWECARYQKTIGESLPRAVVCPKAPALVR